MKKYISLTRAYLGLPPVLGMLRVKIEGYVSLCTSVNQIGILIR